MMQSWALPLASGTSGYPRVPTKVAWHKNPETRGFWKYLHNFVKIRAENTFWEVNFAKFNENDRYII